jgi:hypothetical protein
MGLRPVLINPRTLVRTWGTQTELCKGKNELGIRAWFTG